MTQLTPDRLAEIRERDAHSITWHGNFSECANKAQSDRRALLSHIDALSLAERHAVREYAKWFEQCVQHEERIAALTTELAALRRDAERYRWLRTAGAWESEIGMDELSKDPAKFDAAIDSAMSPKVLPEREG